MRERETLVESMAVIPTCDDWLVGAAHLAFVDRTKVFGASSCPTRYKVDFVLACRRYNRKRLPVTALFFP